MNTSISLRTVRKTFAAAAAVLVAALMLAGCTGAPAGAPTTAPTAASETPSNDATATVEPPVSSTPVVLVIDDREITGTLDDSPTAASLIAQLPLTLTFRDYGGQEKVAELPAALDLTGAPERSGAEALSIGYYSPQQRLVLYYDQVGTFAGIVPLGTFDDLDAVRGQSADFTVDIRPAG